MTNANYQTAGDVFDGWRDDVLIGSPPVLFPIGAGEKNRAGSTLPIRADLAADLAFVAQRA